jgi:hypothetical protein
MRPGQEGCERDARKSKTAWLLDHARKSEYDRVGAYQREQDKAPPPKQRGAQQITTPAHTDTPPRPRGQSMHVSQEPGVCIDQVS